MARYRTESRSEGPTAQQSRGVDDGYVGLSMGTLPAIINKENKFAAGVIVLASTAILYITSNHLHIFQPRLLWMSRIDMIIPFWPSTVWIYISEYFYLVVIYSSYRHCKTLNEFFYAFLSLQLFSSLIFWWWPTAIPRELFPIPADLHPVTSFVLTALRKADTSANCFPSVHVSSVFLVCLLLLNEDKRKFLFFFVWATAITLSTMTVKQHYFVDVAAGIFLALVAYFLVQRIQFVASGLGETNKENATLP